MLCLLLIRSDPHLIDGHGRLCLGLLLVIIGSAAVVSGSEDSCGIQSRRPVEAAS